MAEFQIGLTVGSMTNIEALAEPLHEPRSEYSPYARKSVLANGQTKGRGLPTASWTFGTLTVEQRNQLKTFCPNLSGDVYIRTKLNDDTYANFSATMLWTDAEDRWYGDKRNYTIIFRNLIAL